MNVRMYAALFFAVILFIITPLHLFLENKANDNRNDQHLMICLKKDSPNPIFFLHAKEQTKPMLEPHLQRYCLMMDTKKGAE